MPPPPQTETACEAAAPLDVAIFGGGAAGLWLLDELTRRGYQAVVLEAGDLGDGQTITSQGILHGGLKYTLSGLLTASASAVRDMPLAWRRCLAGEREPSLTSTRLRAPFCHLWHLATLSSRMAMLGARVGLRVAPVGLEPEEVPEPLRGVPGRIARLDEQVIEPATFLAELADRHPGRVLRVEHPGGVELVRDDEGDLALVRLLNPVDGQPLDLAPRAVVLCAGSGNAALLESLGHGSPAMQRRPLHMVMARGNLPVINGHCVDGTATRVTITSTTDTSGRNVWQLGGQLAEDGVDKDEQTLIPHAAAEVALAIPGLDLDDTEWATYRVDRAEAASGGRRPEDATASRTSNVITAWPTKLVLVPRLVELIVEQLEPPASPTFTAPATWPRPVVALPPWERSIPWTPVPLAKPA